MKLRQVAWISKRARPQQAAARSRRLSLPLRAHRKKKLKNSATAGIRRGRNRRLWFNAGGGKTNARHSGCCGSTVRLRKSGNERASERAGRASVWQKIAARDGIGEKSPRGMLADLFCVKVTGVMSESLKSLHLAHASYMCVNESTLIFDRETLNQLVRTRCGNQWRKRNKSHLCHASALQIVTLFPWFSSCFTCNRI